MGVVACCLIGIVLCKAEPPAGEHVEPREIVLNKRELAVVDLVLKDARKRGFKIRDQQLIMTDEGSSYEILLTKDPKDPKWAGGDGIAWKVQKNALRLSEPIFQK